MTRFGREEALVLQGVLDSPSRPKDALGYCESAGFLFAVCCNPDLVKPSEWLPEILGKAHGRFADLNDAQRALQLLMSFYNHINRGVLDGNPQLPWGCDARPEAISNLDGDAPLARWASGFGQGYDWLQESWPDDLPEELDQGLGACLLVLTFFASRTLADAYWKESRRDAWSFDTMAKRMQEMLLPTMAGFAELGRAVYARQLEESEVRQVRNRAGKAKRERKKK